MTSQKRQTWNTGSDKIRSCGIPIQNRALRCRTYQKHVWRCPILIQLCCWNFQLQNGYRIVFFHIGQLSLCHKNCLMMLQYSLNYPEISAFFEAVLSLKHPGMNIWSAQPRASRAAHDDGSKLQRWSSRRCNYTCSARGKLKKRKKLNRARFARDRTRRVIWVHRVQQI